MSWGNPQTLKERALAGALSPAAAAYGLAVYARVLAYAHGVLKQHRLTVPVVSVGNITCGGTGKTPVTIDLARRLARAGHKVGILSRGYRRRSSEEILVVGDGEGRIAAASQSGDEPHLIARAVPDAVVVVAARRYLAGMVAVDLYGCDMLLLDDGFQHFSLDRTIDIALVDYNDVLEKDSLLPAGRLREPLGALARAEWIVLTRVPPEADGGRLEQLASLTGRVAPRARLSSCRFAPRGLHALATATTAPPESLAGVKVAAFCGIARPLGFFQDLKRLGADLVLTRSFPDHHWYSSDDLASLKRHCADSGAEVLVTTEKDAVRLPQPLPGDLPVMALELGVEWLGSCPVTAAAADGGRFMQQEDARG